MKKVLLVLLAATLVMGLMAGSVGAEDIYCNIKANLNPYNPDPSNLRIPVDAGGYVVMNYVKGQDIWNISGEVWNAKPNEEYYFAVGIAGQWQIGPGNNRILTFTTDEFGNAVFCGVADSISSEINILRVYETSTICHTALGAGEASWLFRGVNRGKSKMEAVE
jgi:hypothetical protein